MLVRYFYSLSDVGTGKNIEDHLTKFNKHVESTLIINI